MRHNRYLIAIVAALGLIPVVLDTTIVTVALNSIRDDLHALHRAWRRLSNAFADGNRARRPWRRQLHEAQPLAHLIIVVRMEPCLLGVKRLCPVHIRHRDRYQFDFPVHRSPALLV